MNTTLKRTLSAALLVGIIALPCGLTFRDTGQEKAKQTADDYLPPALTQAHVAYIAGYPNGKMEPRHAVTRAEAATFIYRLLSDPESGDGDCAYTDVHDDDWFAPTVHAVCRLGLTSNSKAFRPNDAITRAEFVAILAKLSGDVPTEASFKDVPEDYWASEAIAKAATLGWVTGYEDGTFKPNVFLTRAEACAIINNVSQRPGDSNQSLSLLDLGLYSDVTSTDWFACAIVEASVPHETGDSLLAEHWTNFDVKDHTFSPGVHEIDGHLYAVDRNGALLTDHQVGAYTAAANGLLSQTKTTHTTDAPYISQLDDLDAEMGCEPIAALMGLQGKGYAKDITPREFLDDLPLSESNPDEGFLGSPYYNDGSYTSINPEPLAEYCNATVGVPLCADITGYSVKDVQRELLAGNLVVAYQTFDWKPVRYEEFYIDGDLTPMVANNHVHLVCGYDPKRGYLVNDPYNDECPGQTYQYWVNADDFEFCWNQRKMGMVIR